MADEPATTDKTTDESRWQWMLKVGVGGVLIPGIVAWMMLTISQGIKSQDKSSTALTKAADAMDDLADEVQGSVTESRELRTGLAPLLHELDRVADAVRAQTKLQTKVVEAAAQEAEGP